MHDTSDLPRAGHSVSSTRHEKSHNTCKLCYIARFCCTRNRPENVRPLIIFYMGAADRLAPPRGQAQVHQKQALLVGRVGLPQQEVLWLHITMHIPVMPNQLRNRI